MSLITPDFGLLVWMTLIFAIVFFILAKFGFPLITGMVDKRRERINASIAKAKEAEESLASLAQRQEKLISEARAEQARILKEASEAGDRIVAKAREDAALEASKIMAQATVQIEAQKQSALRDIRSQVAALSVEVAGKVLKRELESGEEQEALIGRLFDEAARLQDKN